MHRCVKRHHCVSNFWHQKSGGSQWMSLLDCVRVTIHTQPISTANMGLCTAPGLHLLAVGFDERLISVFKPACTQADEWSHLRHPASDGRQPLHCQQPGDTGAATTITLWQRAAATATERLCSRSWRDDSKRRRVRRRQRLCFSRHQCAHHCWQVSKCKACLGKTTHAGRADFSWYHTIVEKENNHRPVLSAVKAC